jgi:DNA-binding PucR family transcriptional regulator
MAAPPWDPPSPAAAELIRRTTARLLSEPDEVFDEVDRAVLEAQPRETAVDPRAREAIRLSNRANMAHWATSTLTNPGAHVPPNLGPEITEIAREVVRRGLDDTSLQAYRVGQNTVWRIWMTTAFELSDDPAVLREMLDVSARSIFTFVDETLAGIHEAMEQERAELVSRTHSERLEVVNLILEHAPITGARASTVLRYELARRHTAAVIWSDEPGRRDQGDLEAAAGARARATGAGRPLTVVPSASTLWAWLPTAAGPPAGVPDVRAGTAGSVRIALGTTDEGIDGFRRSHRHALATQRLMRRARNDLPFAAYADVQLVVLAAEDEARAREFAAGTLGELATAEPVLRDTLRTYIREGFSASRAARALFTHRNTALNRINRAESLLPVALPEHGLEVGLALEILHWLGP